MVKCAAASGTLHHHQFSSLLVRRQDRHVSRLVRFPELGKQACEVERLPTKRDHPVHARPQAGVSVPGQLDPIEIRIVQVDSLVSAVIGRPIDRPAMIEQAFGSATLRWTCPMRVSAGMDGSVMDNSFLLDY